MKICQRPGDIVMYAWLHDNTTYKPAGLKSEKQVPPESRAKQLGTDLAVSCCHTGCDHRYQNINEECLSFTSLQCQKVCAAANYSGDIQIAMSQKAQIIPNGKHRGKKNQYKPIFCFS